MILTAFRVLAFVAGGVAFYVALFLREAQEGQLQNRIEELSLAVDRTAKVTGNRAAALFNKVAGSVTCAFDRILGPRLLSIQMLGVSSCLAFAGLFLPVGLFFGFVLHKLRTLPSLPSNLPANLVANLSLATTFLMIVGTLLVLLAALPSVVPSRFSRILSLLPVALFLCGTVRAVNHVTVEGLTVLVALVLAVLTDICLLVAVRRSIRWISLEVRPLRICLVILAHIVVVFLVLWLPLHISADMTIRYRWKVLPQFLVGIAAFNLFTAIAACAFLLTLVALLLHRLFWPVVGVLFYQIARYKLARNHKAMAALGAICITFAFPSIRGVVLAILGWLTLFLSGETTTPSKSG